MEKLLFVQIADRIESFINASTFRIGDKLPSLRTISLDQGVSIGTALQAYIHLIDKGLVTPKEKTGYFVARKSAQLLDLPRPAAATVSTHDVKVSAVLKKAAVAAYNRKFVSFFSAVPLPGMLPLNAIRRSLQQSSRDLQAGYLGYESTLGNTQLRELIAKRSFKWNRTLGSDDIIITNGTLEAINLCLRAVTKRGDTVLVETPCYYAILQCLEHLGLKVIELPSDSVHGIDVSRMETISRKSNVSACLFVSNFNNPNGVALTEGKKKAIAAFANKTKTPVIDDDVYGELYFGESRPGNIKTYDTDGWVMLCSSFSKTIVPGHRVGWCAPGRFMSQISKLKATLNISTAGIVQESVVQLLSTGTYDRHLRKMRAELGRQLSLTSQAIEDHFPPGTKLSRPTGGYVLWVELPSSVDAFKLQKLALDHHINFAPGPIFSSKGDYRNYIRISCNNSWTPAIDKALKKLGELATDMMK